MSRIELTKEEQIKALIDSGVKKARESNYQLAMVDFSKVLELDRTNFVALVYISQVFKETGNPFSQELTAKMLIKYHPDKAHSYVTLVECLFNMGKFKECFELLGKAIQMYPKDSQLVPNFLFFSNSLSLPREEIFRRHYEFAANYEPRPPKKRPEFPKTEKIKVGFASSDFCCHSVHYFLMSLFENYSREKFEFHLFSNTAAHRLDHVTEKFKGITDKWHDIAELSDDAAAKLIAKEQISVLVDLNGYTTSPVRMGIFGLRPSPVQVSWLGYPNTTGMESIDFHITDNFADSEDSGKFYTEKLLRLNSPFLCYSPSAFARDIKPEFLKKGELEPIVFGSFNNTTKITDEVISLWSAALKKVPNSCLMLKQRAFDDPKMLNFYAERFALRGIEKERLIIKNYLSLEKDHLMEYLKMDIALDTFPYNGTTTTCEAMFMGVPTLALMGESHVSRVSAALNLQAGFSEFVASDEQEFLEIAAFWASRKKELCDYKNSMRQKMLSSLLCDGKNYAKEWEAAILGAIRQVCLKPC